MFLFCCLPAHGTQRIIATSWSSVRDFNSASMQSSFRRVPTMSTDEGATNLPADEYTIGIYRDYRIHRAWMLPMCLLLPRRSGDSALVPVQHRPRKPWGNFTEQFGTAISYWMETLRRCECDEIWSKLNSNDSSWFLRDAFKPKSKPKNLDTKQLRLSDHVC